MLRVEKNWQQDHPGAAMGRLVITGTRNKAGHPGLALERKSLAAELAGRFADRAAIRDQPVMRAYAGFYKRFKKTYHVALQQESVAVKGRPIPGPGALVEAMFLAELKNGILTSVHDIDSLAGSLRVDSARGGESFTMLAGREAVIKAGDVMLVDDHGPVGCIIYGPDKRTSVGPETSRAVYIAWGVPGLEPEALAVHLEDIAAYVRLAVPESAVDGPEIITAG